MNQSDSFTAVNQEMYTEWIPKQQQAVDAWCKAGPRPGALRGCNGWGRTQVTAQATVLRKTKTPHVTIRTTESAFAHFKKYMQRAKAST